jgi:hypothetical protein
MGKWQVFKFESVSLNICALFVELACFQDVFYFGSFLDLVENFDEASKNEAN